VLLNLVPLKSGGGLQVGLAFLRELEAAAGWRHEWLFMTTRGTRIDEACQRSTVGSVIARVRPSIAARLYHEQFNITRILQRDRPDVAFTLMGPGIPRRGSVRTVTGTGYSNLYYPEIAFWQNWPLGRRLLYQFRDLARAARTNAADVLVVETDQIACRARLLFGFRDDAVRVVPPSANPLVSDSAHHSETARRCETLSAEQFKVLMLTGWHFNKGIDLVPRIAAALRDKGANAQFVITVEHDHPFSRKLMRDAATLHVDDAITLFGSVPPEGCAELYRKCDATMLLSVLESFSNNMVETWTMSRPLVITDSMWSRAVCNDAAIYVDRLDPNGVADAIIALQRSPDLRQQLIRAGQRILQRYPTVTTKAEAYIRILESVAT
jgi:glycosyltransferase involved in cell wall biosynthesis